MYQRVKAYIEKHHMLQNGDKVIVGISGGADSVCLLFMLLELKKEMDISIVAVHIHHGLRAGTADADEAYVRELCEKQQIRLFVCHEDVKAYAQQQKLTVEEAGRNIRRIRFEETLRGCGGNKIALAHHQNDNAETLLWNLCRGCGLRGAGGIAPAEGAYIRPLLCLERREIEGYLSDRGISYCIDETNLEDTYTRNRIRSRVIPYLEAEINPRAVQHMSDTMEQLRLLGEYVEHEMSVYARKCIDYERKSGKRVLIKKEEFMKTPEVLRSYMLHELLCRVAGRRKDIEQIHVKMLGELFEHQVGREISLPYSITAGRSYEGIELYRNETNSEEEEVGMSLRVFEKTPDMQAFPKKTYTKWFDYDIIKNTVKLRHKEPGDWIVIDRSGRKQKLKQYFINEKIPREDREKIWIVADGQEILWIVGYRQSQKYQVTENTRRILEIEICGGKRDGREC